MKTITAAALTLTLGLLATAAFGQEQTAGRALPFRSASSGEANAVLPENYVLSLTVTDKETAVANFSLVVAAPKFDTQVIPLAPIDKRLPAEAEIAFRGTVTPINDEWLLIQYVLEVLTAYPGTVQSGSTSPSGTFLEIKSVENRNNVTTSTARLHIGAKPITILKAGTRTYDLSITRLSEEKGEKKK